jgi:hypothetical protein
MVLQEYEHFHFIHGTKAEKIDDLKEGIIGMTEADFKHHVTAKKNDFATWLHQTFKEEKLASKLRKIKTKENTIKALEEYLEEKNKNYSIEYRRFVVKEFMYGLVIGLIIGFIIAKLI